MFCKYNKSLRCRLRVQLCNKPLCLTALFINEPRHDKTNKMSVRPAKTHISLGIRPVWSESSLCAQWVAKDPSFLHADSEDSDQTGRIPRLNWVFAGHKVILLVFVMSRLLYFYSLCLLSCARGPVTSWYVTIKGVVTRREPAYLWLKDIPWPFIMSLIALLYRILWVAEAIKENQHFIVQLRSV